MMVLWNHGWLNISRQDIFMISSDKISDSYGTHAHP